MSDTSTSTKDPKNDDIGTVTPMAANVAATDDGIGGTTTTNTTTIVSEAARSITSMSDSEKQQAQQTIRLRRYIYNDNDLQQFIQSPTFDSFYKFTVAMGKACSTPSSSSSSSTTTTTVFNEYNSEYPYLGCSPGIACFHGVLSILKEWIYEDEFNPSSINDQQTTSSSSSSYRFGHPLFRKWHALLVDCSKDIITTILHVSHQYSKKADDDSEYDLAMLQECYEAGRNATIQAASHHRQNQQQPQQQSSSPPSSSMYDTLSVYDQSIVTELSCYLNDAFGHPIRLDYGTGHETSFHILLYLLCEKHCNVFTNIGYSFTPTTSKDETGVESMTHHLQQKQQSFQQPSLLRCKAIIISIYFSYLEVTRALQTVYMLEPAGSHGVWGLDDYYCLAFYYGACQLVSMQKQESPSQDMIQQQQQLVPSSIHDSQIVERYSSTYLYFSCIQFIKSIKKNVPFYESSPMLNDISYIATWYKIAMGLCKLYHGEVLCKRPVVQHLLFGALFSASWTPSQSNDTIAAPTEIFRNNTTTVPTTTASTSTTVPNSRTLDHPDMPTVTRAPWAK